ncbi:MAG: hypothetical protein ACP5OA_00285 [Candidatus Woesearchaeota archaeon]
MGTLEKIINSVSRNLKSCILATTIAASSLGIFRGCEEINPVDPVQPQDTTHIEVPESPTKLKDYGRLFFFSQPNNINDYYADLWTCKSDGSRLRMLDDSISFNNKMVVSPDQIKIAYIKKDACIILDTAGIVQGKFPYELISHNFSWTPDSKSILFPKYTKGIYRYDVESKQISMIYKTTGFTYDHDPVMNKFDNRVAFIHHEYGDQYQIYVLDNNSGAVNLITSGAPTYHDDDLDLMWIDQNHLVYENKKESKIYYVDTDTKSRKEIAIEDGTLMYPILSPDMKTLALKSNKNIPYLSFLNVEDLQAGKINLRNSTIPTYLSVYSSMAWSPDSKYIATQGYFKTRIYDTNSKEYLFLEDSDFPTNFKNLIQIGWTH